MATTNERLQSAVIARTVRLLRFDLGLQNQMSIALNRVRRSIIRDLTAEVPGSRTPRQVSRANLLLASIDSTIANGFDELGALLNDNLIEVADLEAAGAADMINQQAKVELITTQFSAEQLQAAVNFANVQNTTPRKGISSLSRILTVASRDIISEGVLRGQTNQEIGKRLNSQFDQTNRQIRALTRTAVQEVANDARNETWRRNSNVVKAVQQVSTLDDRTTLICTAYSGKVWTLPDYAPVGHDLAWNGGPPRHWQCRSTTIPIVKSFAELGLDVPEPDTGRRAAKIEDPDDPSSLIGTDVPADITFDEFLKKRSIGFQNRLLGPKRAKLFRENKITTTDLVNANGDPLTLKELKTLKGITDDDAE